MRLLTWANWPCCDEWPAAQFMGRTLCGRHRGGSGRRGTAGANQDLLAELPVFQPDRFQQLAVFIAQAGAIQQIGSVDQRLAQLLLAPPAANLLVVPVHQHLRARNPANSRGGCSAGSRAGRRAVLRAGTPSTSEAISASATPKLSNSPEASLPSTPGIRRITVSTTTARPVRPRSARSRQSIAPCRSRAG